jgi:hypothetical protein
VYLCNNDSSAEIKMTQHLKFRKTADYVKKADNRLTMKTINMNKAE